MNFSTGVVSDIGAVRRAIDSARHPALLLVDTISSLGSIDYRHDAWGVDVTVAGSQKGLMLPPGLGFCALSDKAWAKNKTSRLPKYYFDLAAERKTVVKNEAHFTPAVSIVIGLRTVLSGTLLPARPVGAGAPPGAKPPGAKVGPGKGVAPSLASCTRNASTAFNVWSIGAPGPLPT